MVREIKDIDFTDGTFMCHVKHRIVARTKTIRTYCLLRGCNLLPY